MKHSLYIIAAALLLVSCKEESPYAAEGAFEATEVTVSAEANGKLLMLNVQEGDSIAQGALVAQLDTASLILQRKQIQVTKEATLSQKPEIEAQLATIDQQVANLLNEKARTERLIDADAAPKKQLDDICYQIATLNKQKEALRSSLSTQTEAINSQSHISDAQVNVVNEQVRKCQVTAPISGIVLTKFAETGEVVSAGKPLFKVADTEHLFLRAYFTSDQLASLKLGQQLKIVADFGGGNTRDYTGTISSIATQSEFTPKTIQTNDSRANLVYAVKIAVKNDGYIKLGMCGKVLK